MCFTFLDRLIPTITDLEVVTTIGSFNVSAKWQLEKVTEFHETIDYYYVTIFKLENRRPTKIYWLKTKGIKTLRYKVEKTCKKGFSEVRHLSLKFAFSITVHFII